MKLDDVRKKQMEQIGGIRKEVLDEDVARVADELRADKTKRHTFTGKKGSSITMTTLDALFQKAPAGQPLKPSTNPVRLLQQNVDRETARMKALNNKNGACQFCLCPDDVPVHRPPVHFKRTVCKEWICDECDVEPSGDEDFCEDDEGSKGRLSGTLNDSHNPHPSCLRIPICCITLTHTLPRCRIT